MARRERTAGMPPYVDGQVPCVVGDASTPAPTAIDPSTIISSVGEVAYEWRLERVRTPDGRFGVVCYFSDTSDRKRAEDAAREDPSSADRPAQTPQPPRGEVFISIGQSGRGTIQVGHSAEGTILGRAVA